MLRHWKKAVCLAIAAVLVAAQTATLAADRFSMTYLYGSFNYSALVDRTGGALDEVAPSWFDLNSDGSLKLNAVDTDLVTEMHSTGVRVVPFLSNHWDSISGHAALANSESLSGEIAAAVTKYALDGVNVDLENLDERDTANYVAFVKRLREKLGPDTMIAVAVAANPDIGTSGWRASYDYTALAKYADYLMIMAYDEHSGSSAAGPVASIGFAEKSIQYALKYVDEDQIVLGLPFYGRYWKSGSSVGGYGISLEKIGSILSAYQSAITYDYVNQSVKAVVTIKNTDTKPVINGRTLSAGTYTFWYENEVSLKAKLALIDKYDLRGAGSWSLGQETSDTWLYYTDALNGIMLFSDVSAKDWFYSYVRYVTTESLFNGTSTTRFSPNDAITRGQFVCVLYRLEGSPAFFGANGFSDVVGTEYYYRAVAWASSNGIVTGYSDGTYRPNSSISREQMAAILYRYALYKGYGTGSSASLWTFRDAGAVSAYALNAVKWAVAEGLISGITSSTIAPQSSTTRAQAAAILTRLCQSVAE